MPSVPAQVRAAERPDWALIDDAIIPYKLSWPPYEAYNYQMNKKVILRSNKLHDL